MKGKDLKDVVKKYNDTPEENEIGNNVEPRADVINSK